MTTEALARRAVRESMHDRDNSHGDSDGDYEARHRLSVRRHRVQHEQRDRGNRHTQQKRGRTGDPHPQSLPHGTRGVPPKEQLTSTGEDSNSRSGQCGMVCFSGGDMKPPEDLGVRGKELWTSITSGLNDGWELDDREREVLVLAARQADDLARLEKEIGTTGVTATGSQGQVVVSPMVPEARQARMAISKLLNTLELPDGEEQPRSQASLRAERAARSRWDRRQRLGPREELRRGA